MILRRLKNWLAVECSKNLELHHTKHAINIIWHKVNNLIWNLIFYVYLLEDSSISSFRAEESRVIVPLVLSKINDFIQSDSARLSVCTSIPLGVRLSTPIANIDANRRASSIFLKFQIDNGEAHFCRFMYKGRYEQHLSHHATFVSCNKLIILSFHLTSRLECKESHAILKTGVD